MFKASDIHILKGENMKMLGKMAIVLGLIMASSVQANINDFECEFVTDADKKVEVVIERPFGGSTMRDATMSVSSEEDFAVYNYYVSARFRRSFNRLKFSGANFDLEVNLWPDQRPRWGRTYRSEFRSWDLDEGRNYYNVSCRYTGL